MFVRREEFQLTNTDLLVCVFARLCRGKDVRRVSHTNRTARLDKLTHTKDAYTTPVRVAQGMPR